MRNRKWLFILIIFISFFVFFDNSYALEESDSNKEYYSIEKVSSLEYEGLEISNIKFHNNVATSTKSFGLTMDVKNNLEDDKNFVIEVTYYDKDYNPITTFERDNNVLSGEKYTYVHMSNISLITNSYTPFDIKYYDIKIKLNEYDDFVEISDNSELEYYFDKYHVDIKVKDNNIFEIKEKINAYFNVDKHGIIRNIPMKNTVVGTNSNSINVADLFDLEVDDKYTLSSSDNVYSIRIGDAGTTIRGEKEYNISYSYYIGKDPNDDYDEFYFNIIGTEWDTKSNYVTFKIEMPKEFDPSLLGFSSGRYGRVENEYIHFKVKGNVIEGYLTKELSKYEGLTIRLELPEGYFVKENITLYDHLISNLYLFIIFPIIFFIPIYLFWKKHGKDKKLVETVEFYPPEGLNSLEVAFINNDCTINMENILSLIVYLASKGYIKISDAGIGTDYKHSFTLTKLKEYDGSNICEKMLFDGLFINDEGESIDAVNTITLGDKFTEKISDIYRQIGTDINTSKYKYVRPLGFGRWIWFVIILGCILISIPALLLQGYLAWFITLCTIILVCVGISLVFSDRLFIGLVFFIISLFLPFDLAIKPLMFEEPVYFVCLIICIILNGLMGAMANTIDKRTDYGTYILGRIRGFKRFLEIAEKPQLEALVLNNPTYFYDILPYTYVLGVSRKWISKFEDILIKEPEWFNGCGDFDLNSFSDSIEKSFSSINSTYYEHNHVDYDSSGSDFGSSSSSSSSGGGSSGGGSGGGGGSSW